MSQTTEITKVIKEGKLEVTTTVTDVQVTTYDYPYLLNQLQSIQDQKDQYVEQRDKEIDSVKELIQFAKDGGLDLTL